MPPPYLELAELPPLPEPVISATPNYRDNEISAGALEWGKTTGLIDGIRRRWQEHIVFRDNPPDEVYGWLQYSWERDDRDSWAAELVAELQADGHMLPDTVAAWAAANGLSERSAYRLRKVVREANPAVTDLLFQGKIKIGDAAAVLYLSDLEQWWAAAMFHNHQDDKWFWEGKPTLRQVAEVASVFMEHHLDDCGKDDCPLCPEITAWQALRAEDEVDTQRAAEYDDLAAGLEQQARWARRRAKEFRAGTGGSG